MSELYFSRRLTPRLHSSYRIKPRPSPGDGLKDLPSRPIWL
jgi:hypothetical protein